MLASPSKHSETASIRRTGPQMEASARAAQLERTAAWVRQWTALASLPSAQVPRAQRLWNCSVSAIDLHDLFECHGM